MTIMLPEELEQEQLRKYRSFYNADKLDHSRHQAADYFGRFAQLRADWVKQYYQGGTILDLCCGSGDYLMPVAQFAKQIIGLDFSPELVEAARHKVEQAGISHATLQVANAKAMPLSNESVDLIFSFSSLYYIPNIQEVFAECARVLKPGGFALLELGISHSLNTVVCHAYPETAAPCHIPLATIPSMIQQSGLTLIENRGFQVLPLWGQKPKWLRPLLHPVWRKIMALDCGGQMLDERLSNLWPLSHFAFRRMVVCQKAPVHNRVN